MRKMIEYIFELYYWVRPAGLIVQSVLTAKTLDQNQLTHFQVSIAVY
jgi:hypothetical protein